MPELQEKKVEYVELIYDLIFVYLVSKNAHLLLTLENGFIKPDAFFSYLASTLAVLQIWYLSAIYMNRYGDGSLREHLMLFLNMYLLYHMADGIRADWGAWYFRYNLAWALILLNMAFQYFRMGRSVGPARDCRAHRDRHALMLVIEAAIVLLSIPLYTLTGWALSPWALVFGLTSVLLTRRQDSALPTDFHHLSERVMLYVVFTFGEMLLAITGYFDDGVSLATVYYSLMAFAMVVGLFSGYGHYYNHLIDLEHQTTGNGYMLLHIVMLLALNNVTAALELMQHPGVRPIPKTAFLVVSLLVYYICLLMTQRYAAKQVRGKQRFYRKFLLCVAAYCLGMALLYRLPAAGIALSVAFIYLQLYALHRGSEDRPAA